jgi:cytidine deaminase
VSDVDIEGLLARARAARERAYAPYSRFLVGAALVAEDGSIHDGANVENVSFGLTICAERTAATAAVASGVRRIEAIAIVGSTVDHPTSPCGACRQFLYEFNPSMTVVSETPDGSARTEWTLSELLPAGFGAADLPRAR